MVVDLTKAQSNTHSRRRLFGLVPSLVGSGALNVRRTLERSEVEVVVAGVADETCDA
jgi:hypothetical protein